MATVWFRPLHVNKGKTIAKTLADRTDYAENPDKTERGELVTGFMCDPRTADEEFLLAKKEYEFLTGRNQGAHNVLAYHARQSFLPGEVSPQEANEIGYELALRFFKGRHAFIVATHVDRHHVHNHIIVNSTRLDCLGKFWDFKRSDLAIRRVSDLLCAEHGLSVIENPKPSKGRNYGKWLGDDAPPTWSETLKRKIDEVLPSCAAFEDFISALKAAGYEVNEERKHISVRAPGQKKNRRLDTLKGDYTEAAIRERLGKVKIITTGGDSSEPREKGRRVSESCDASTHDSGAVFAADSLRQKFRGVITPDLRVEVEVKTRVSLLVDIQAKIREGRGAGYEQWAKIFNLKQAAKTLIFLQENGIDSYDDLVEKASTASGDYSALTSRIKEIENRQKSIAELQKQIGVYGKTRDVFAQYKASKWSRAFYDAHAVDIVQHRAAKKYFDELGMSKLPSINSLKQEWATLNAEKKSLYADYHKAKDNARELQTAKYNADMLLGVKSGEQSRETARDQSRREPTIL